MCCFTEQMSVRRRRLIHLPPHFTLVSGGWGWMLGWRSLIWAMGGGRMCADDSIHSLVDPQCLISLIAATDRSAADLFRQSSPIIAHPRPIKTLWLAWLPFPSTNQARSS
jgi:hypothetical protein